MRITSIRSALPATRTGLGLWIPALCRDGVRLDACARRERDIRDLPTLSISSSLPATLNRCGARLLKALVDKPDCGQMERRTPNRRQNRVKHVMNVAGVVFVFGVDLNSLRKFVNKIYGDIDANGYLSRIKNGYIDKMHPFILVPLIVAKIKTRAHTKGWSQSLTGRLACWTAASHRARISHSPAPYGGTSQSFVASQHLAKTPATSGRLTSETPIAEASPHAVDWEAQFNASGFKAEFQLARQRNGKNNLTY